MLMFISCDWGTSSFRLRLVDQTNQAVLAEVKSSQGIVEVNQRWRELSQGEEERLVFYQLILAEQLKTLQQQVTYSLKNIPVIISGMASSNIGMVELPYKVLPFAVDGSDLIYKKISATDSFPHESLIISGTRTDQDVMRGEEIQLIGCDLQSDKEHGYILPGTHSKHVTIKDKKVIDFKTYMTGEFFHLLSHQSILSKSIRENTEHWSEEAIKAFEDGVLQSTHDNLLHNAFLVRTNHLFERLTREVNYHYLSGLLIGTELRTVAKGKTSITIVGNELMRKYYAIALRRLGNNSFDTMDVDIALIKGQSKMARLL